MKNHQTTAMKLTYPIVLKRSEEEVAIACPVLPSCWSQGDTEEEAIEQIPIAIHEYLEADQQSLPPHVGKQSPKKD